MVVNDLCSRVLCRKIGYDLVNDLSVFTESDSKFCVDITSTKDGKFITVYVIDSANPMDGLQRLCERSSGVQYFVEHHSSLFYILTNAPLPDSKCSGGEYYLVRISSFPIKIQGYVIWTSLMVIWLFSSIRKIHYWVTIVSIMDFCAFYLEFDLEGQVPWNGISGWCEVCAVACHSLCEYVHASKNNLIGWCPPQTNYIKLNTNGAYNEQQAAGCGGVIRGCDGEWLGGFAKGSWFMQFFCRRALGRARRTE
ncbi:protease 2-like protein, partial [Trifolium pratense]